MLIYRHNGVNGSMEVVTVSLCLAYLCNKKQYLFSAVQVWRCRDARGVEQG